MKKIGIILLTLLITVALGIVLYHYMTIPREEGVCKLKTVQAKPSISPPFNTPFIQQRTNVSRKKPDQILDMPTEKNSETPLYFVFTLNQIKFPGVVYRGEKQWTIYADINLNGKLSDEKAVVGKIRKKSQYRTDYVFGPLSIEDPSPLPIPPVYLAFSNYHYISLHPAHYRTGKIRLNGTIYRVALMDGNYDGKHNSLFVSPKGKNYEFDCDVLAFDMNQDRNFSPRYYQAPLEVFPLSRYIKVQTQYYEIISSEDGHQLRLNPAEPAMGKLKVGKNTSISCQLYSDAQSSVAEFTDEINLPAGQYVAYGGKLTLNDSNGDKWRFSGSRFERQGPLTSFTIQPDKTHEIALGPPFTITSSVGKANSKINIRIRLQGRGGETFSARVYKNGHSLPRPTLKIFDENEVEIHTGQLEYG